MGLPPLTRTQRVILIISVLSIMAYSIVNIALSINSYSKVSSYMVELDELVGNWRNPTILDLSVAANCQPPFMEAISSNVFPGTKAGCNCANVATSVLNQYSVVCQQNLCDGACSSNALAAGCVDVAGHERANLSYVGKIHGQPMKLCAKKSLNETWETVADQSSGACDKPGYLRCGYSPNNQFCSQEQKCAINSLTITEIPASAAAACTTNCLIISNDGVTAKKLEYTRGDTFDALPLAELRFGENGMCRSKLTFDMTPGRVEYSLLEVQRTSCNNAGAAKWNITDSFTEEEIYTSNNLETYISSLSSTANTPTMDGFYPTGKTGDDYSWHLFTNNYIPWNVECRDRMLLVFGAIHSVKQLVSPNKILLILSIVSGVVMGIILTAMELYNLSGRNLPCIPGKDEAERTILGHVKRVVKYIFKFVQLPFQIYTIKLTAGVRSDFSDMSDDSCTNADTQTTISYYASILESAYWSNIAAVCILGLIIIMDIALIWWGRRKASEAPSVNQPGQNQNAPKRAQTYLTKDSAPHSQMTPRDEASPLQVNSVSLATNQEAPQSPIISTSP